MISKTTRAAALAAAVRDASVEGDGWLARAALLWLGALVNATELLTSPAEPRGTPSLGPAPRLALSPPRRHR